MYDVVQQQSSEMKISFSLRNDYSLRNGGDLV